MCPGGEVVLILSKLQEEEQFSVFLGPQPGEAHGAEGTGATVLWEGGGYKYYNCSMLRFIAMCLFTFLTTDHGKKLNPTLLETVYQEAYFTSHVSQTYWLLFQQYHLYILGGFKGMLHTAVVFVVYVLYVFNANTIQYCLKIKWTNRLKKTRYLSESLFFFFPHP